jgi:hypothetical protein
MPRFEERQRQRLENLPRRSNRLDVLLFLYGYGFGRPDRISSSCTTDGFLCIDCIVLGGAGSALALVSVSVRIMIGMRLCLKSPIRRGGLVVSDFTSVALQHNQSPDCQAASNESAADQSSCSMTDAGSGVML